MKRGSNLPSPLSTNTMLCLPVGNTAGTGTATPSPMSIVKSTSTNISVFFMVVVVFAFCQRLIPLFVHVLGQRPNLRNALDEAISPHEKRERQTFYFSSEDCRLRFLALPFQFRSFESSPPASLPSKGTARGRRCGRRNKGRVGLVIAITGASNSYSRTIVASSP